MVFDMTTIDFSKFGINIPPNRTTGKYRMICPNCNDRRTNKRDKCLSIDIDRGLFKCHYCGFCGCAKVGGKSEKNWMQRQPWFQAQKIAKQPRPAYKLPTATGSATLSAKLEMWFKGRGISPETVEAFRVTEGLEWMPQKNGQANTVQFNYYLGDKLINTKYRTGDKCFKMVQGAELIPYHLNGIKYEKECIITEGEMDALSFAEAGRFDVVSVPNGANANLTYLDDYFEEYFDDKEVIYIASDTDTKGIALRDELLRRFGAERCRVVTYGEGCKDANEHLQKYGKESLLQCLNNAPEVKLEGVFTVSDFEQPLDDIYEHGMQRGVTIGHDFFDSLISFETKRLCIVTGIPSSGKSEFIDEIVERLNLRYDWRAAYFSPENAPLAYHASKLIEKFTGKKFDKLHLPFGEYQQVKEHIGQNVFFIAPKDDYKLSTVLARAKYLVSRKGIKIVVIDPFNRLDDESGGRNDTHYIGEQLKMMTNFAQQNDVLVILMVHPAKQPKNKDGGYEAPTLYDCSGSANFYNMTDFGISIHRNYTEDYVEVHVQKVKFRHLGHSGMAKFKFNINNGRYTPFDDGAVVNWDNSNHLVERERNIRNESQTNIFTQQPPKETPQQQPTPTGTIKQNYADLAFDDMAEQLQKLISTNTGEDLPMNLDDYPF